ncbi:MAG: hypothetical protein WA156_16025 [Methylocystis silviterrae]
MEAEPHQEISRFGLPTLAPLNIAVLEAAVRWVDESNLTEKLLKTMLYVFIQRE